MSTQDPTTAPWNCSFCSQEYREARPVLEGPDGVSICHKCMRRATDNFRFRTAYCSFCSQQHAPARPLAEGPNWVYICYQCIRKCAAILEQEQQRRGMTVDDPMT